MVLTHFLKHNFCYLSFILFVISTATAQISPPGLGQAKNASWFALGLRQDLNAQKSWQSMSYIGIGRKSSPSTSNLFQRPAIMVFNQEFYRLFARSWQASFALSYRRQHEYAEEAPYPAEDPALQQEFRIYARLSKKFSAGPFTITPTLRQELRRFYTPDFRPTDQPLELRSRFRVQLSRYVDQKKKHKVMLSSEQLFTSSRAAASQSWSAFAYKESRLMCCYSYAPTSFPAIFDIGYMYNILGDKAPGGVHYLALDIILKNPFGTHKS